VGLKAGLDRCGKSRAHLKARKILNERKPCPTEKNILGPWRPISGALFRGRVILAS